MIDLPALSRQLDAEDSVLASDLARAAGAEGLSADARAILDMLGSCARAIHQRQATAIKLIGQTNV